MITDNFFIGKWEGKEYFKISSSSLVMRVCCFLHLPVRLHCRAKNENLRLVENSTQHLPNTNHLSGLMLLYHKKYMIQLISSISPSISNLPSLAALSYTVEMNAQSDNKKQENLNKMKAKNRKREYDSRKWFNTSIDLTFLDWSILLYTKRWKNRPPCDDLPFCNSTLLRTYMILLFYPQGCQVPSWKGRKITLINGQSNRNMP